MRQDIAGAVYRMAARARGERTFSHLAAYNHTQWLDPEGIRLLQERHLDSLVKSLRLNIPFYRNLNVANFGDMPIINRVCLKENGSDFINPFSRGRLTQKKTSGSTGEPVIVWRDAEAMAREQAITLRGHGWASIKPGDRQARFWGTALQRKKRLSDDLKDFLLNRKRFAAFNFTDVSYARYLRELETFNPGYVYGYVSMLRDFSQYLLGLGTSIELPALKAIITTSEVLTPESRRIISEAFGVSVYNEYGCSELGTIAHECEKGNMHLNSENLFVEILHEDGSLSTEGKGKIVVTEFHNGAQPLVRYELGDYGTLGKGACECGRGLPMLESVHGKAYDIIFGPAGRKYFPEFFSYIFKQIQGHSEKIRQFQVVQEDRILRINLVKARDFHPEVETEFTGCIHKEFGNFFECRFAYFDSLKRENSGKFRQVMRISPSEPFPDIESTLAGTNLGLVGSTIPVSSSKK